MKDTTMMHIREYEKIFFVSTKRSEDTKAFKILLKRCLKCTGLVIHDQRLKEAGF